MRPAIAQGCIPRFWG